MTTKTNITKVSKVIKNSDEQISILSIYKKLGKKVSIAEIYEIIDILLKENKIAKIKHLLFYEVYVWVENPKLYDEIKKKGY